MNAVACVKWKNETFAGFWFLTNFLREEGFQEQAVKTLTADLTKQYEAYRGVNGKLFTPQFVVNASERSSGANIVLLHPVSGEKVAHVSFVIDEAKQIEICPF
jgi:hypothetical protein